MPENDENLEENISNPQPEDVEQESDSQVSEQSETVNTDTESAIGESSVDETVEVNVEDNNLESDVEIAETPSVEMTSENENLSDIFSDLSAIATEGLDASESNAETLNSEDDTVTVQPVKFAAFDDSQNIVGDASKNMDNLLDINLRLTVELGRATLPVRKVLELTRGSIVELEKIAGEPVELFANGKLIAHGEVVVIEDNFGLRITSMTEPENRLNELQ
ncbi:MAG: flagellar motor switch protein FliN [Candidatus Gastranaerophilaceae bacterium]